MHYELYVDSLFLMNFGMNLYLLLLVNRSTMRTAGLKRILLGAAVGSGSFFLLFIEMLPPVCRFFLGALAGPVGMLFVAFPIKGVRMFVRLLERLLLYAFCMGGLLLFFLRVFPGGRRWLTGVWGILIAGGIACLFLRRSQEEGAESSSLCHATLYRGESCVAVAALIDSGNSLTEPVSGKPVSVIREEIFRELWREPPQGFRAIPYHSIGKSHGILKGYLLPKLCLEIRGVKKEFQDVYVAVGGEGFGISESAEAESVKMIVNPVLLNESAKGRPFQAAE